LDEPSAFAAAVSTFFAASFWASVTSVEACGRAAATSVATAAGDFAPLQPHANAVVNIPIIGNKNFCTSIS
jgi:hypothetical protein